MWSPIVITMAVRAVRSLQINIIEDVSCGERKHNRCWYLHLYSVNIKSKHRWYPNISFGMLQCSIILSPSLPPSLPTQCKNLLTLLLLGMRWWQPASLIFPGLRSPVKNISESKLEFYLWFVRRTGSVSLENLPDTLALPSLPTL